MSYTESINIKRDAFHVAVRGWMEFFKCLRCVFVERLLTSEFDSEMPQSNSSVLVVSGTIDRTSAASYKHLDTCNE